jgi:TolB-like protein/tetratricopeptide (TPR) repeat protein
VTLRSGEAYDEVTEKALADARVVLVLWSPRSVVSRWVRAEATEANRRGTLVPVMIEPCKRPILFELTQTAELSHWTGDRSDPAWVSLVADIRRLAHAAGAHPLQATATTPPNSSKGLLQRLLFVLHRDTVVLSLLGGVVLLGAVAFTVMLRRGAPEITSAANTPASASIAVLPFVNMSGDPGREIISDGISEELLNDLANVSALRVAARTSSFAFKGKNEDIKTIAGILSVRTILEGSIREDGEHIRIAAQLINAADGYHLWSATYDRQMTGILTLEDEIARSITSALTNKLLGTANGPSAGKPASIDPIAYRKYLEGQHEFAPRTADGVAKAVVLFKQVAVLQPDFADGLAALGRALIDDAENNPGRKDLMPAAEAALARALALDPDNVAALSAHLDLALHRMNWSAAAADASRLNAISASSAPVLHEMFRYYQMMGFPNEALETVRNAAKLDPLSFVDRYNVVAALIHNGQFADAIRAAHEALALLPDQTEVLAMLCRADSESGHIAGAHLVLATLSSGKDATSRLSCEFDIDVAESKLADAHKIADGLASQFPQGDFGAADIGELYARSGEFDKAVAWLARAYDGRDFDIFTVAYTKSIPAAFFNASGWRALLRRPLFRDWQAAHDSLGSDLAADR